MGYLENLLPRHLSRLGHDVHVITSSLPPYYQASSAEQLFGIFAACDRLVPGTVETYDGYTLHIVDHGFFLGRLRLKGLWSKLRRLAPDVVQIGTPIGINALQLALITILSRFVLFTGNHQGFSTFPLACRNLPWYHPARLKVLLTRGIHGRFVSLWTEKCYAVTPDCAINAWRYFGVQQHKVEVMLLGVDTESFHPCMTTADLASRSEIRKKLGFSDEDIVCAYSGKMDESRNPLLLARAIKHLHTLGRPFRAFFIGEGPQREEIESMRFSVLDFMPYNQVANYFRAADIAVWPGWESISQLDAAACGIPIVVGDVAYYRNHVDGNGFVYKTGNLADLIKVLGSLEDPHLRQELGRCGAEKMYQSFSWSSIALRRSNDYQKAHDASRRVPQYSKAHLP